jgi:hypothetical protein
MLACPVLRGKNIVQNILSALWLICPMTLSNLFERKSSGQLGGVKKVAVGIARFYRFWKESLILVLVLITKLMENKACSSINLILAGFGFVIQSKANGSLGFSL